MIVIEKAQEEDLKEILGLQYIAYQSEAMLFNSTDIPPLRQTIEEVYDEFRKGMILKASDGNGVIIGSVRAYQENGTVYIGKLMVHPSMQKKGIGTRLLSEMEKQLPAKRYELFTSTKSVGNIRLYESLGYEIFKAETVTEELHFVYMQKNSGR
ncbi:MAG: GNAT family N-acetyltransferase [Oscillospiraceae bacterium]|nr:GNAT family N-acetyltransferase [Oscillospiraceae bacterium]